MAILLSQLIEGDRAIISAIHGEDQTTVRLYDMGLTPGTRVELALRAPHGDPLVIHLRGYSLSLRRSEADRIVVRWEDKQ